MRVVTWNIHSARGIDGVVSARRIAETLAALEPDVVGLNEVRATPGSNQAHLLSELLGMPAAFQRNLRRPGFRFGNAVLVRGRLLEYGNILLPSVGEQRGLLLVRADLAGGRPADGPAEAEGLLFGSTHLGLLPRERRRQLAAIAEVVPEDEPAIIAGDFNDIPGRLGPLEQRLHLSVTPRSFPARMPRACIDLMLHSSHFRLERSFTVRSKASDHLPVVADFARTEAAG